MADFPRRLRHGSGQPMDLEESRVLVELKAKRSAKGLDARLKPFGICCEATHESRRDVKDRVLSIVNDTPQLVWLRAIDDRRLKKRDRRDVAQALRREAKRLRPVYRIRGTKDEGGLLSPAPDRLLVRFDDDDAAESKRAKAALKRLRLVEEPEWSRYLAPYRCFRLKGKNAASWDTIDKVRRALGKLALDVSFEHIPLVRPTTLVPGDTHYGRQWSMPVIDAPEAWDVTVGHPSVVIAILDEGCDLSHPDLQFASNGINLGTMSGTGAPTGSHGTACAGIAAGTIDNGAGVAGVAGGCEILPIAFSFWSDTEVAAGIRYAVDEGADVVSMSFGHYGPGEGMAPASWNFALIDPAIEEADAAGIVLVAATGNEDVNTFNRYPARHAMVLACGGTSTDDDRKTTTSPDGECWGANFANGVSVVAPCVQNPTTDRQGAVGYNSTGGAQSVACVTYNPSGDTAGDYFFVFNGTSSACPHVAGVAGLCRSVNCLIGNRGVRDVIELTADKVGPTAYTTVAGFPNGTRNQPMGYGRVNAKNAVDHAGSLFAAQVYGLLH